MFVKKAAERYIRFRVLNGAIMVFVVLFVILGLVGTLVLTHSFHIVPQRMVFIVERLGKYHKDLEAGFHVLIPFLDKVAYKHSLKEYAIDTNVQVCITRDNIPVEVDGVLYLRVVDPGRASYGINDYLFATTQIAQTTMRSVIGRLDLDQTFEERDRINVQILDAADKASDPWGIKVTRYEIKDIKPPKSIYDAMEKQMRAEREKRAIIAESEGEKQARINRAIGHKEELISHSEGEKLKRINEAEGKAQEVERLAEASALAIQRIASELQKDGGDMAVKMRLAQDYIEQFGKLAQVNNTMIVPTDVADVAKVLATAMNIAPSEKMVRV